MVHRKTRTRRHPLVALVLLGVWAVTPVTATADGQQLAEQECARCHAMEKPETFSAGRVRTREAPDLYYAGNKFRAEWLERWLQDPYRIRPAGTFFGQHVVAGEERDIVDPAELPEHPAYTAEQAEAVTEYLMTLTPYDELLDGIAYEPGSVSMRMGEMNFSKFKGCIGCHEIEPGYGGLSGPEVYTAFRRTRPEFLFSFLRDPQAWEPKTFMPDIHLNDGEVAKLVDYLKVLSED